MLSLGETKQNKAPKYMKVKGGILGRWKGKGKGTNNSNIGSEDDHRTLHACMELR
jgi:hypothetical protein